MLIAISILSIAKHIFSNAYVICLLSEIIKKDIIHEKKVYFVD